MTITEHYFLFFSVFQTEMNMQANYNRPFMYPQSGENLLLPESPTYYNLDGNRPNSTPGSSQDFQQNGNK